MAITVQRLFAPVQLGTSLSTLYTSTGKTIIDKFSLANVTGAAVTGINIYLVPSGGTAGNDNLILPNKSLAAGETYVCPELVGHTLENTEFIRANAGTAAAITVRGSGRVVT